MEMVPTPTNEKGLVLLPPSVECLGDECELSETTAGCYTDLHHLYFTENDYEKGGRDSLYWKLRHSRFNIIPIARCQHNLLHAQFLPVEFPEPEVVRDYLEQSSELKRFGHAALETARFSLEFSDLRWGVERPRGGLELHRNPAQLMRLGHLVRVRDQHFDRTRTLATHLQDATLLQPRVVANPFVHMGKDRPQRLRQRASHIVRSVVDAKAA